MSKVIIISPKRIYLVFSCVLLIGAAFFVEAFADDTPSFFPVDLYQNSTIPEEATVIVNIYKPADAVKGIMTLSIYDADIPNEGEVVINGSAPIALFDSSGVSGNDKSLANITISTPASYWNDGHNTLLFRHTRTAGYKIHGVTVLFDTSSAPDPKPSNSDPKPDITPDYFPVDLYQNSTIPEESSVIVNVYKPADVVNGIMTLSVYDADITNEGEVVINGNTPIALFGSSGVSGNDKSLANITISTPASYWNDGNNTLLFRHTRTAGYKIHGVTVLFDTSSILDREPVASLSINSINFGSQYVGGISDPWPLILTNNGTAPLVISGISTSEEFIEANNCNSQVPAGGSCTIDIQYLPATSGTTRGKLTITADDAVGIYVVKLVGTGIYGAPSDTSPGAPLPDTVLHVNFNDRALGLYEKSDLVVDFQVGQEGYKDSVHGPDYNATFIVNDPAGNTGRGRVLEVKRFRGYAGSSIYGGGMRFRADFTAADEYYFAFDMFVPSVAVGGYDFWFPFQHKQPAMINGTLLESSHATGKDPEIDGIIGFNSRTQFFGQDAYGRGEGSASTKPIDAKSYKTVYFWDIVDPSKSDKANTFHHPRGRWITIEQHVKLNTADTNDAYNSRKDLADGVLEVWITDPAIGWYGKKVKEKLNFVWRYVNTMKIDGLYMYDHYGGKASDPRNQPPQDQSKYYDNFIVSPAPITH